MRSAKEDRFCETALFTGDPCGFGKMFVENVFAPRHVYLFLTEGIKINAHSPIKTHNSKPIGYSDSPVF